MEIGEEKKWEKTGQGQNERWLFFYLLVAKSREEDKLNNKKEKFAGPKF